MLASVYRETVSNLTGTGSLIVWIFAQSPQIYQNYATKSVEGLSFVFLLQWTIGDLTNFIGAFLTKQLPIQIIIAAYMLTVDLTLCAQYALYYRKKPEKRKYHDILNEQTPLLVTQHRHTYRHHHLPSSRSTRDSSKDHHPDLYRTNSVDPWFVYRLNASKYPGKRSHTVDRVHQDLRRSRDPIDPMSESTDSSLPRTLRRGRSRDRKVYKDAAASDNAGQDAHHHKKRRLRLQPSMSRRGTNMILMGMGMMMTMGPWSLTSSSIQKEESASPSPYTLAIHHYTTIKQVPLPYPMNMPAWDHLRHPILLSLPTIELARHRHKRKTLPLSMLVGRIFAWFCTVLYMTSRLPQIWANYQRKSVRGLSWLLFLLAFLANLLYSSSILSNPKAVGPSSQEFLSESLPFLIGSGGTLVFDMIILIQYWMWHDRSTNMDDTHGDA